MRHAEESKRLRLVSLALPFREELTKNLPLNSKVLWNTPFAPSFPMTKLIPLIINLMNFSR
jgi:hypothetical protein